MSMQRTWKMVRIGLAACALLGGRAITARADGEGWTVSLDEAQKQAKAENKTLLMEFTGSDWCPPCKALKKNVLDSQVFHDGAPAHYVQQKLDNPRDKSKQSEEEQKQYRELSAKYKITGVPTIILADAEGRPIAKIVGYNQEMPAEKYFQNLIDKKQTRVQRDEALAKAEKATGLEKAKLLDQALRGIDSELVTSFYKEIADQIIGLDGTNQAGLKERYEGLAKLASVREELQNAQREMAGLPPAERVKKIDELITRLNPTGEGLQEVLFLKANLLYGQNDKAGAKALLLAAQKAAPETDNAKQIDSILERFFKDVDAPAAEAKASEGKDKK